MKLISTILIIGVILSCSSEDPYEQEFIEIFNEKIDYPGLTEPISTLDLAGEVEQFLLDKSYITDINQDEYFNLINKLLTKELVVDQEILKKNIPNSWLFLGMPSIQACVLKCGNRIVDENPNLPIDHPVKILTNNLTKLAQQNDLANLAILKDIIYSLPPEEFEKLHYHLHPIIIIERIMEENSR